MVKQHNQLMISLLVLGDLVSAALAWIAAYYLRAAAGPLGLTEHAIPPTSDFTAPFLMSLLVTLLVFTRLNLYQPKRVKNLYSEAFEIVQAVVITWGITYVAGNFLRDIHLSRILMAALLGSWIVIAVIGRIAARGSLRWFRSRGWNLRYAAIVGAGRLGHKLLDALKHNGWTGIVPRYFIDDPERAGDRSPALPLHGPLIEVDRIVAEKPVDIVFVALPTERAGEEEGLLDRLATREVDVRVIPDLLEFHFLRHDVSTLDNLPIITLSYTPQHGWNAVAKRLFDLLFSLVALAVLAPPMLIIALAIKLNSRGPVFFIQERASISGRPFRILKFRSMVVDAEAETGPVMTGRGDPRVTRVGRLLRRTSLDELPQLINVLLGQMSLVGPRPERPEFIEQFRHEIPRYVFRHQVKAGLTGWAQVHGLRGNTDLRKRIQYDLHYIANWSFGLDMRIILMTLSGGMFDRNAD
jgi:Undecaprenyl-phosphate glucose phosphotransferase